MFFQNKSWNLKSYTSKVTVREFSLRVETHSLPSVESHAYCVRMVLTIMLTGRATVES
jgi:hypothetical protein